MRLLGNGMATVGEGRFWRCRIVETTTARVEVQSVKGKKRCFDSGGDASTANEHLVADAPLPDCARGAALYSVLVTGCSIGHYQQEQEEEEEEEGCDRGRSRKRRRVKGVEAGGTGGGGQGGGGGR